eukprot:20491-Prymnesium_polylepis.1
MEIYPLQQTGIRMGKPGERSSRLLTPMASPRVTPGVDHLCRRRTWSRRSRTVAPIGFPEMDSETGMVLKHDFSAIFIRSTSAYQARCETRSFSRATSGRGTHGCSRTVDRNRRAQPPPSSLAVRLAVRLARMRRRHQARLERLSGSRMDTPDLLLCAPPMRPARTSVANDPMRIRSLAIAFGHASQRALLAFPTGPLCPSARGAHGSAAARARHRPCEEGLVETDPGNRARGPAASLTREQPNSSRSGGESHSSGCDIDAIRPDR